MKGFVWRRLLVCGIPVLIILSIAHASLGIGIQPNRVEAQVPYGEIHYVDIALSNPSDVTKEVDISLAGVKTHADGTLIWLGADGSDAGGEIYIYAGIEECASVEPSHLLLPPRSTQRLQLRITVPESLREAGAAGRAGALWFDVADRGDDGALFDSIVRFISFVLITFDGGQNPGAEIAALGPSLSDSGNVLLPVQIQNIGNVHLAPEGSVIVRDRLTDEIVVELALPGGTVLPQCPREYAAVWTPSPGLEGSFRAEFAIYPGEGLPAQTATISFRMEDGMLALETP